MIQKPDNLSQKHGLRSTCKNIPLVVSSAFCPFVSTFMLSKCFQVFIVDDHRIANLFDNGNTLPDTFLL